MRDRSPLAYFLFHTLMVESHDPLTRISLKHTRALTGHHNNQTHEGSWNEVIPESLCPSKRRDWVYAHVFLRMRVRTDLSKSRPEALRTTVNVIHSPD